MSEYVVPVEGASGLSVSIDYLTFDSLAKDKKIQYMRQAAYVAEQGFGWPHSDDPASVVEGVLAGCDVVAVSVADQLRAFAAYQYFQTDWGGFVYLSGIAVDNTYQARGVGGRLIQTIHEISNDQGRAVQYIAGTTQNPRFATLVRRNSVITFPFDAAPTEEVLSLITIKRESRSKLYDFDTSRMIEKGFYDSPLYDQRPISGDDDIQTFFDEFVGPNDGVLVVGQQKGK